MFKLANNKSQTTSFEKHNGATCPMLHPNFLSIGLEYFIFSVEIVFFNSFHRNDRPTLNVFINTNRIGCSFDLLMYTILWGNSCDHKNSMIFFGGNIYSRVTWLLTVRFTK